jgi:hypothetical protein
VHLSFLEKCNDVFKNIGKKIKFSTMLPVFFGSRLKKILLYVLCHGGGDGIF